MTRVVIDPGVFVSGLIGSKGAPPDRVQRAVIGGRITAVACPTLFAELEEVLSRPKLRGRVSAHEAREYVRGLRSRAELADDPATIEAVVRDPDDDYIVALARAEHVDAIVSGDRDLLEAGLTSPPVVTPRELIERLTADDD